MLASSNDRLIWRFDSAIEAAQACLLPDPVCDTIQGQFFERLEIANCPLCYRQSPSKHIRAGYGMQAVISECKRCRIAYQSLRPSPEATLAYMNWRWSSTDEYVDDRNSQLRRGQRQIRIIEQYIKPQAILDFGAGAGAFVRAAHDAGYHAVGVERSDIAVAKAKSRFGIQLSTEIHTDAIYDAVTLWDVIEHLRNPLEVLTLLRSRTREGGMIFIETGNWESWTRLQQRYKWGLVLFDHQYYFSPYSLKEVVEKAGFREFHLLDVNRSRPRYSPLDWLYWLDAKRRWPHGSITIMVGCARA